MLKQVKTFIKKEKLIKANQPILLAVSGGPDSAALLDMLYNLRRDYGIRLLLAHFNHKIRKDSDKDEQFVGKLAKKYRLELVVSRADKKLKSEAEARKARFAFLKSQAKKKDISQIALAHNKSDNLETVLLNLIRGTGLRGMIGIKPKRKEGGLVFSRPLLVLTRGQIIDYLKTNDLNYRIDKSNLKEDYKRNKVRHQIVPELKKLNPKIEEKVFNSSLIYEMINSYLKKEANGFLSDSEIKKKEITFKQEDFVNLAPAIKREVVLQAIKKLKGSRKDIEYVHLKEILEVFTDSSADKKTKKLKGLKFVKQSGNISISLKN